MDRWKHSNKRKSIIWAGTSKEVDDKFLEFCDAFSRRFLECQLSLFGIVVVFDPVVQKCSDISPETKRHFR